MTIDLPQINIYLLLFLVVWTMFWKGIALWKAARNEQKIWFMAFFLINTLGILEIIYIYLIPTKVSSDKPASPSSFSDSKP